jgi:CRISPR/Cas system CSM-associated protein Csm3 (group 7 of RAMP superfamily)
MKKIAEYEIVLTTSEPFRIGTSKDVMSAFDNPVAMVGGQVVVQGPTLKGFLRSRIEEYLIDKYAENALMKPCIPSSENTLSKDEDMLIKAGRYREKGACQYSSEDPRKKSNSICPVCYFLGANGLNGFVRVPYLYTESRPEELYSVRIDRAKDTVVDRTNRNYQIMPDKVVFKGTLEVLTKNNVNDWELGKIRKIQDSNKLDGWLNEISVKYKKKFMELNPEELIEEFILERIRGENIIGGFKSKGCGKVNITVNIINK